ncbi:porin [Paraburkholderia oxyphila]|uniref:porin n=1 Tax=Paraburkholderia oxyphila TaxID=614212 RepID=UPI000487B686|nr:porin [Paraburkholderia oxyphila]
MEGRSVARSAVFSSLMLASSLAYSQSSVSLYGIIDTAVEYYNHAAGGGSFAGMPTLTGEIPSEWGLTGAEDLGGGNKAIFKLENGFAPGTGGFNYGGREFGRQAYVGLQNAWGTLTLGRLINMTTYALLSADVIGPSTHSLYVFDPYLPNARSDNAIGYMGKFAGVTVGGTYSFGRDAAGPAGPAATNCPGQVPGNFLACKQYTALLAYDSSQFGVAASYDRMRGNTGASAPLTSAAYTDSRTIVDGYFTLPSLKVGGGWIHRSLSAGAASTLYNLYFLGLTYAPIASLAFDAQVDKYIQAHVTSSTNLVARANYYLTPHTTVYASVSYMINGRNGSNPVAAGGTVEPGAQQLGVMAGVRHVF